MAEASTSATNTSVVLTTESREVVYKCKRWTEAVRIQVKSPTENSPPSKTLPHFNKIDPN